MAYKNTEAAKYSETGKLLIKSVTSLDEKNENFQECYNYVLSSLLYHPYTDANSHEVMHKISRLYEKFLIQSDLEKAKIFKTVTDNLINFFNNKPTFQKEQGFRILSLLLHLSESRNSNMLSLSKLTSITSLEESQYFDWTSYLREDDINCNISLESDSEYLTTDESAGETVSSEDDSLEDLPDPLLRPPPRDDSGLGISPDSCSGTSQLFHPTAVLPQNDSLTSRLEKNSSTFYPYWLDKYHKPYGSSPYELKTMNFTKIWNDYLASQNLFTLIDKKVILHERNVLKETLWMLTGVQDLFVVHWDGGKFIPNSKIHLCNLTSNTLSTTLNEFCTYATKKALLSNNSKNILMNSHDCFTYQAYGESLHEQLQIITNSVCELDKILRKGMDTLTLIVLKRKMKPLFNQIDFLYQIHKEVSAEISNASDPFVKSCRLIHVLWKLILNQSIQEQTSDHLKTVMKMFLKTCKPYFTFLEDLLILGSFKDLNREFLIKKRDVSTAEENYWEMSLELRSLPRDIESEFIMKPFLTDILSAGKSLQILNEINSLLKQEPFRLHAEKGDLYLKFLQILQRSICHKSKWLSLSKEIDHMRELNGKKQEIIQKDPLLEQQVFPYKSSFSKFFCPSVNPAYKEVSKKSAVNLFSVQEILTTKIIDMLEPNSLKPLTLGVTKALSICMDFAYNPVCRRLMKSFREDHNIITHMNVMRKYFLMEAGDLMYSFYSEIFHKIFNKEPWRDISFLYSALQNAIYEDKDNCEKLYVFLTDPADRNYQQPCLQQPLSYLSTFQLSYRVKWPITMMLGKSVQSEYSQIFTFLLQIKCTKYMLDNLYSLSLCKQGKQTLLLKVLLKTNIPREHKMHGMHIIRMRLMFFVNGLHNYIMTRILHSFGVEFHDALEKAETVEEMFGIHKNYLKSLHERCLLDRRISFIKDHIFEVLNMCYNFQQLWLKGVDDVSIEELRTIENQFSKVSNILICCFTKPLRRGTYLHLESLVSTMLSNSHSLHIFDGEPDS